MTSNFGWRTRSQESNLSENDTNGQRSPLLPQGVHKWTILGSAFIIHVILPSILPSLGILLYFELQDRSVSLKEAIWTPIFFTVSWCLADSWGQTASTSNSFRRAAIAGAFVAGTSVAIVGPIRGTYGSLMSLFLVGITAGIGTRLLMTISESIMSERFSNKSKSAIMIAFLGSQSFSLIIPPVLIAFVANSDGVHYAFLFLGALIYQTLPAAFLLRRSKPQDATHHMYLTTQPAYALLHNDEDEEVENELFQTESGNFHSLPRDENHLQNSSGVEYIGIEDNEGDVENTPVPLFTNVELVSGTYQGDVAFSFEDTLKNEYNTNDDIDIVVRGSTINQRANKPSCFCCFRCSKSQSVQKEFHPLRHKAFYLGVFSTLAQKMVTVAMWVLLPGLISLLPYIDINGYELSVPRQEKVAVVPVLSGLAAIPLVFFMPSLLHSSSYASRRIIHGISTIVSALGVFAIGRNVNILYIGTLMLFGLSNAVSSSTLEPLFKEALLGSDQFLGYKNREKDWGPTRGLANIITGLTVLAIILAIDISITDWSNIDWSLVFYMIASVQAFSGLLWVTIPSTYCH